MYQKYITEYSASIAKYKRIIEKAKASNDHRVKVMILIYIIPFLISFVFPDPLFKLPLIWPLASLSASSLLSLPIYNAFRETNLIIDGALEKIDKLESDIGKMKDYDKTHTVTVKKKNEVRYAYDKNKKHEVTDDAEKVLVTGRGRK